VIPTTEMNPSLFVATNYLFVARSVSEITDETSGREVTILANGDTIFTAQVVTI